MQGEVPGKVTAERNPIVKAGFSTRNLFLEQEIKLRHRLDSLLFAIPSKSVKVGHPYWKYLRQSLLAKTTRTPNRWLGCTRATPGELKKRAAIVHYIGREGSTM